MFEFNYATGVLVLTVGGLVAYFYVSYMIIKYLANLLVEYYENVFKNH